MRQYLDLLTKVMTEGDRHINRTGVDTLRIPGEMLKFDLSEGFPAVTTKKLFYDTGVVPELQCFLEGTTSLKRFQELGCKVWDKNMTDPAWLDSLRCKDPDDMGKIYGYQWRNFGADEQGRGGTDQIAVALAEIRKPNPSRRIVVNAWHPGELNQAVLPPCHVLFQLHPNRTSNKLHMTMYQRSCDMFLGIPFNIASYATLLHLFAAWGGYDVGTLTMFLGDVHIYENHFDQVKLQLSREPKRLPSLFMNLHADCATMSLEDNLKDMLPEDFKLFGYESHPYIPAPMAR